MVHMHKRVRPGLSEIFYQYKILFPTGFIWYGYFVFILNFALNNLNCATYFFERNASNCQILTEVILT